MTPIEPILEGDRAPRMLEPAEEESLFQKIIGGLGFARRACLRHPVLAAFVFCSILTIGLVIAMVWPSMYRSEVHMLAQPNRILPNLGNPHRPIPWDADAPTKAASEAITRQDNLLALVEELKLLDAYDAQRNPLLKLKDQAFTYLGRPTASHADRVRGMAETLESRIKVKTDTDSIVVAADWPDREMALRIVQQAQKNFLDGRFSSQMAMISEAIAILDTEMNKERAVMDGALAEVLKTAERSAQTTRAAREQEAPAWPAPRMAAAPILRPAVSAESGTSYAAELSSLNEALSQKRAAIREIEEPHQRHLNDLRRQLAELRLTLNDSHPQVVAMEKRIEDATAQSPETARLRAEERDLMMRMERLAASGRPSSAREGSPVAQAKLILGADTTNRAAAAPRLMAAAGPAPGAAPPLTLAERAPGVPWAGEEPADLLTAREKLQNSIRSYTELKDRADAARIELITEQAAFKYRYTVIKPAELAKGANPPGRWMLFLAAFVVATVSALATAAIADLASGRVIEPWQIERAIGVPVLAEVKLP